MPESGQVAATTFSENVLGAVRGAIRPELVNRLTEIIVFQPIQIAEARLVIDKFVDRLNQRLQTRAIHLSLLEEARVLVLSEGFSETSGAREIERTVERLIANPLAEELLRGRFQSAGQVIITREKDKLIFRYA
jgi:ATP-dependent Clp protease ATP-binding subunit ClpC